MSLSLGTDDTVKVRIVGSRSRKRVVFNVTPDLAENRAVTYKNIEPIHMPGQIIVYQGTNNRTFNISTIKIVSRTKSEAAQNLQNLNLIRSWTLPHFGREERIEEFGDLGSPPEVLLFSAYANEKKRGNIYKVPTVLTNLLINYPSDVDYISADDNGTPFPTLMTIDLNLVETHSPREFSNFSISDYRNGQLTNF